MSTNHYIKKSYRILLETKTPTVAMRILSDRRNVPVEKIEAIVKPKMGETGDREPVAHALFRGMTRVNLTPVAVVLFWEDGILKASLSTSISHASKLNRFDIEIIGTYEKGTDIQDVYDDIMEFYK